MIFNVFFDIALQYSACHPTPILLRFECHEWPCVNQSGGRKLGLGNQ